MKSTFSIIFYLKRQVVKKDGTVPVMGRITVDGTQAQFSCKVTANPKLWDTKGGRMTGKSMLALEVNRKLDKMRVSINKHYQEILDRDNYVTAEKVKNAFLGLEYRCQTLLRFILSTMRIMRNSIKRVCALGVPLEDIDACTVIYRSSCRVVIMSTTYLLKN